MTVFNKIKSWFVPSKEIKPTYEILESEINNHFANVNFPQQTFLRSEEILRKAYATKDENVIQKAFSKIKDVETKLNEETDKKSRIQDPVLFKMDMFGYKTRETKITVETLRMMSNQFIIRAIHSRIINFIAKFARPQKNDYEPGFLFEKVDGSKITSKDKEAIDRLTKFTLQTGNEPNKLRGNFEQYLRKATKDSLSSDWCPSEIVWTKGGEIDSWWSLDPATIMVADTYTDEEIGSNRSEIYGKRPSYVQHFDTINEVAEFYEWEMMCPLRNPSTNYMNVGYGRSELEDLIIVVTAIQNSVKYNSSQFIDGIPANNLIWMKGAGSQALDKFRRELKSQSSNLNAGSVITIGTEEKPEMLDIRKSNKDMEYSQFVKFLVTVCTALYNVSAESCGLDGALDQKSGMNFESGVDKKLKFVMSEACDPILGMFEGELNDKIYCHKENGQYRFRFGGLGVETPAEKVKRLTDKAAIVPINEIMKEMGLPKTDLDDHAIFNAMYIQLKQMSQGGGQPPEQGNDMEKAYVADDFDNYFQKSFIDQLNNL